MGWIWLKCNFASSIQKSRSFQKSAKEYLGHITFNHPFARKKRIPCSCEYVNSNKCNKETRISNWGEIIKVKEQLIFDWEKNYLQFSMIGQLITSPNCSKSGPNHNITFPIRTHIVSRRPSNSFCFCTIFE